MNKRLIVLIPMIMFPLLALLFASLPLGTEAAPPAVVEMKLLVNGEVREGARTDATIFLRNRTRHGVTVYPFTGICIADGCLNPLPPTGQFRLGPGESRSIAMEIDLSAGGDPSRLTVPLYFAEDGGGLQSIDVAISSSPTRAIPKTSEHQAVEK